MKQHRLKGNTGARKGDGKGGIDGKQLLRRSQKGRRTRACEKTQFGVKLAALEAIVIGVGALAIR